jgi:hypothetical protein
MKTHNKGKQFCNWQKFFLKKVATITDDNEIDLSDCISLEEFGKKLKQEVRKSTYSNHLL